jgi:ABC-type dipeptide/oligopeptide/nickel transport system permease subunit
MEESPEHLPPSATIDLTRRTSPRMRGPLVGARLVAMPYVTMTRLALAQLVASRRARVGALVLGCIALVAIFSDFLASDLPLLCRWNATTYVLPNIMRPAALSQLSCARMRELGKGGDWMIAPLVAFGPTEKDGDAGVLLPPCRRGHPLGTDAFGRDVFARVVHGSRTALGIGVAASVVLVSLGIALGALGGFAGGLVDGLVARTIEALTSIPTVLLVLVVGALVPRPSTATLLWTIALTRWTELARIVRVEVLQVLGRDYVTAARALGGSGLRILLRHIMPNAIAPAIVAMVFGVASVVLVEAAVDFLRVGSPDTIASWGEAMGEARAHADAWWLIAFPGVALLTTLIACILVGEAARDALDPKLREHAFAEDEKL